VTVEEFATSTADTTPAAVIEAPVADVVLSEDDQLESAWSKLHPQDRVERGDNGKFVSPNADTETPPEGGEGEAAVDASTVPADVPLPANWQGLDETWAKIPADARAAIAEHQQQQHAKLSDMGRKVSQFEPLQVAASEFAEYFNGNLKGADGQPINPADGIRYLANIQRMMDKDAPSTILQIIDTYGARETIAAALGVTADGTAPATDTNTALLAKIDRLEQTLKGVNDPSKIEEIVERRETKRQHEEEVRRLTSAKPLYSEIPEEDMVFYINKAWKKLGDGATKAAVLDHAYNAAVEADPALRAKSQAARKAAEDTAAKAEAAKRGASVNVKSTASGASRTVSEDDAMEEVWRKHQG
jgi:hypothetical protein